MPDPIPPLPDEERRTRYTVSPASAAAVEVGFDIYGSGTDATAWVEVYVDGELYEDWTLTSPSGPLNTIARPITDAIITPDAAWEGTIDIVASERPYRTVQLADGRSVDPRTFNFAITQLTARQREAYDNFVRSIRLPYGDDPYVLPQPADRADTVFGFGSDGTPTLLTPDANITQAVRYDINQSLTGSQKRTARSNVGIKTIIVDDYCNSNDALEAWDGVQAALTAAGTDSYNIVFGKRTFRFLDRTDGQLTLPTKGRIIFEPGAVLDFSAWGRSGTESHYLAATGTAATSRAISSGASLGSNQIVMSAGLGANFAAGDLCIIQSTDDFTTEDGSLGKKSEWVIVTAVATDTLTLQWELRDTYTTSPTLTKITPCELTIENPQIVGAGRFTADALGDRGLAITYGKNIRILGGNIYNSDANGVRLISCFNGLVDGTNIQFEPKGVTHEQNQYGVAFNSLCEHVWARNTQVIGGKEAHVLSGTGSLGFVMRDIGFVDCRSIGAWRSGFATHDAHENFHIRDCTAEDCEQGIDIRISGATVTGCRIAHTGGHDGTLDRAILIGSGGGKLLIANNTFEDVLRGVQMPNTIVHEAIPGDIHIINNVMRDVRGHGIALENKSGNTDTLGTISISGNDITCATSSSPQGVQLEGKWTHPVIAHNVFRGGNAAACIYLHATANGAGTSGAVSPIIINNQWESTFAEPVLQHNSGLPLAYGNIQIGASAFPIRTLSAGGSAGTVYGPGYILAAASGTADNFDTITIAAAGTIVTFFADAGDTITVRHNASGTDILRLIGSVDRALSGDDSITFISNGTLWVELGSEFQPADADLTALAALSSTGLIARSGSGTAAVRTIAGTANEITVTNGSGVSGDPTLSLPSALTFTGKTVTGGTFTGIAMTAANARTNAANNALEYIFAGSAVAVSHTGNTDETVLATITIPAGAMGANGWIEVDSSWSYTNSGNNKVIRVRLGGISGTAFMGLTSTTSLTIRYNCTIANRNSESSQVGAASATVAAGWGSSTGALVTGAINTANSQDIVLTATLANSGETITLERYSVKIVYKA